MRIKKLDKRLELCLSYVKKDSVVADIGTDHAYLPINLVHRNIARLVYACDINYGPLEKAKENIQKYNFQDKIHVILTNGLSGLQDKQINTVIVAGMGSEQIIKILKEGKFIRNRNIQLVLQPMTDAHLLREFLSLNHFYLIKEQAVRSNSKVYTVMLANYSLDRKNNQESFIYLGKLSYKSSDKDVLDEYLTNQIKNLRNISEGYLCKGKFRLEAELQKHIKNLQEFISNEGDI